MGLKKQPKDMNPDELLEYLKNFPQLFEGSFDYEGMAVDCGPAEEDVPLDSPNGEEDVVCQQPKKADKESA